MGAAIGFLFRAHYFILLLPAFAVAVGVAVHLLQDCLRPKLAKIIPLILFAVVFGLNVRLQEKLFFELPSVAVCRDIYGWQNPFVESVAVARFIREHSAATARVAVVGSEPEIYFYAQRHSATGYIYTYPLMETQPYAVAMQREMINEIEASKPEYLVLVMYRYSWLLHDESDTEILSWIGGYSKEFYEKVGLVNARPGGQAAYLWGDDARKYQGPLDQFFEIYKRKPTLIPAKTN